MMYVRFAYDIAKDKANYQYCLVDKAYPNYGRDQINILPSFALELQSKLESASTPAEKHEVIASHLQSTYSERPLLTLSADTLSRAWDIISSPYIDKLCRYFQIKKYKALPITCYLTTLQMCPYNHSQRYFYVPFYANLADQTRIAMHELMHIVFLDNYEQYLAEKGISKQGTLDICESLTVLLNLEFKEFLLSPERNNKPTTQGLQDKIVELYKAKEPFVEILDELIRFRVSEQPPMPAPSHAQQNTRFTKNKSSSIEA